MDSALERKELVSAVKLLQENLYKTDTFYTNGVRFREIPLYSNKTNRDLKLVSVLRICENQSNHNRI